MRYSALTFALAAAFGSSFFAPTAVYAADDPARTAAVDAGKDGSSYGKSLAADASAGSPTLNNKTLEFTVGNRTVSVEVEDLTPCKAGSVSCLRNESDFDNQKSLFAGQDRTALMAESQSQKDQVHSDSLLGGGSIEGIVYSVVTDLASHLRDDYSEADFLAETGRVMKDVTAAVSDLVDCSSSSTVEPDTDTVHLPKLVQCQQVLDNTSSCTILHTYTVESDGTVRDGIWSSAPCMTAALGVTDGYAKGTVSCVDGPAVDGSGCFTPDGATKPVCPSAIGASPIPGISPFCRQVAVTAEFNFYKGNTGCWPTLKGYDDNGAPIYEEVCGGENRGGNLDTCAEYRDSGNCTLVSSTCTRGAQGASGTCYVTDAVYDCGKDVKVPSVKSETTYSCEGIACLGDECIDAERTYSTDFSRAATLMSTVSQMGLDIECNGLTDSGSVSSDPLKSCRVFSGEANTCPTSVGGWQSCCASTTEPDSELYLRMVLAGQRGRSRLIGVEESSSRKLQVRESPESALSYQPIAAEIAGQYTDTKGNPAEVVKAGVGYLEKPFSTAVDNLYGRTDYTSTAMGAFKSRAAEEMKNRLSEELIALLDTSGYETRAADLDDSGRQTVLDAANAASETIDNGSATVLSAVDQVWIAYQTASAVMNAEDYRCTREAYETVSRRDAGNCHYIGSFCKDDGSGFCVSKEQVYCCYGSPLSRIMAEYLKDYYSDRYGSAYGWGTPQNPKCGGFTLQQAQRINWNQVNLDEWTAIIAEAELTPADKSLTALTGERSATNWSGSRGNVAVRSASKLNGTAVDGLRVQAQQCIELELGNGVKVRGGCVGAEDGGLECTLNDALTSCEDLAYRNSLEDLLGHPMTNERYESEGFKCTEGSIRIECSSLYSEETYWKALEEYANLIGGTTLNHRFVCIDKSGTYSASICENAMMQNYCRCRRGQFVCLDGNKPISCDILGATYNRCECMDGVCETECTYGGIPYGLEDNPEHACTKATCPYGRHVNGVVRCDAAVCPYG